jgi:hypothetical protein
MLFDEQDYMIAHNRPTYHFGEWLTAIHLYHAHGHHSLLEQYEFPSHKRKQLMVDRILPEPTRLLLREKVGHPGPQCPDLLVFRPDFSDWFFCEVKRPGESVSKSQRQFFAQLEEASGKPVRVARVVLESRRTG